MTNFAVVVRERRISASTYPIWPPHTTSHPQIFTFNTTQPQLPSPSLSYLTKPLLSQTLPYQTPPYQTPHHTTHHTAHLPRHVTSHTPHRTPHHTTPHTANLFIAPACPAWPAVQPTPPPWHARTHTLGLLAGIYTTLPYSACSYHHDLAHAYQDTRITGSITIQYRSQLGLHRTMHSAYTYRDVR